MQLRVKRHILVLALGIHQVLLLLWEVKALPESINKMFINPVDSYIKNFAKTKSLTLLENMLALPENIFPKSKDPNSLALHLGLMHRQMCRAANVFVLER